jgi:hypothetical protein
MKTFRFRSHWTVCCLLLASISFAPAAAVVLVPTNAVWKYLANGADLGTVWQGLGFNDSGWPSGAAQLGYGDGDETTVIVSTNGVSRPITTYFRRKVAVSAGMTDATLRLMRDDGAVVYINGVEVRRDNMPDGPLSVNTLATLAVGGADESTYFETAVSPSAFIAGTNIIAVEVHQNSASSSDMSFAMELIANFAPPGPIVNVEATNPETHEQSDLVEAPLVPATFRITRTGPTNNSLGVGFQLGGTAVNGVDYETVSNAVSIPAGSESATIEIVAIDDSLVEGTESVVLTIQPTPCIECYNAGTNGSATAYILDNEPTNAPPTVWISRPQENESFVGPTNILLRAVASDPEDGYEISVAFYVTNKIGDAIFLPTLCPAADCPSWDLMWSNVPPGNYILTAKATDKAGAITVSTQAHFSVVGGGGTNLPPSVTLNYPHDGDMFTAPADIFLFASVQDPDGPAASAIVEFFAGTNSLGFGELTDPGPTNAAAFRFRWSPVPAGSYAIRGVVTDTFGLRGTSAPVNITVFGGTNVNQPPLASLIAPTNGSVFTQGMSILLKASASDPDGSVARVEFYRAGTLFIGSTTTPVGTNATYNFMWSNAPAGTHNLRAVAVDNLNARGTSSPVTITVQGTTGTNTIVPVVRVTATDSNAMEEASLMNTGRFTFTRTGPITNSLPVYFSLFGSALNGVDFASISNPVVIPAGSSNVHLIITPIDDMEVEDPEIVVLSLVNSTNGMSSYQIGSPSNATVFIYDNDTGNTNGNQLPVASWVAPTNGSVFTQGMNILLRAAASDPDGWIARVEFFRNGVFVDSSTAPDTNGTYNAIWGNTVAGTYSLWAVAVDGLDARGTSAPVNVTVVESGGGTNQNQLPVATWLEPTNGSVFTQGMSMVLVASASDADGTISRVDFLRSGILIGSTTAPDGMGNYTLMWTNAPAGTHTLRAIAIDNLNARGTSSPVTITVVGPPSTNLPTVQVFATDGTAIEAPGSIVNTGRFTFTRTGSFSNSLTVYFALSGTASNGADYTLGTTNVGTHVIPAGSSNAHLIVTPIDDSEVELTETAVLTLLNPPGPATYRIGSSSNAAVLIYDNDTNPPPATNATLIAARSVWKYNDTGSDLGTVWREPGYDDSFWALGPAQLGFGDGDEATVVSNGSNGYSHITYYFRRAFNVTGAADVSSLTVRLLRDDGGVVYLNGVEIFRSNMPTGAVNYTTVALTSVGGADETSNFYSATITGPPLVEGLNVVAVEIHQATALSGDVSFDLSLTGEGSSTPTNQPPSAVMVTPHDGDSFPAGTNIFLGANASDDGALQRVDFYAGNTFLGQGIGPLPGPSGSWGISWTNVPAGNHALRAVATDMDGLRGTSSPVNITVVAPPSTNLTLIAQGSIWKYLDNGSDQGTAWREPAFNDAAWAAGPAQLGYGDGDEATVVNGGTTSNRFITTYFRRAFEVENASSFSNLTLRLLRDDGGIVYLNGIEVFRSNMPTGAVNFLTLATLSAEEPGQFQSASVNAGLLVNGQNVVAVEIHQNNAFSSDISFDLELLAGGGGTVTERTVISVVATDPQASESGPAAFINPGQFAIRRTGNLGNSISVAFTLSGAASNGADYASISNRVVIPAGATQTLVNVMPLEDGVAEGTESVVLTIDWPVCVAIAPPPPECYVVGSPDRATVFINDAQTSSNHVPYVQLNQPREGDVFVAPTSIVLQAYAQDAEDGNNLTVQFFAGTNSLGFGTFVPTLCPSPYCPYYSLTWSNPPLGNHALIARATDSAGATAASAEVHISVVSSSNAMPSNVTFVASGSVWKYNDTGADLGTAWRARDYDDWAWPAGPAELGYGDGDEATVVSYGTNVMNKNITTYFRRWFHVSNVWHIAGLNARMTEDDGAVVYLNGVEVFRSNLPDGTISYNTLASSVAENNVVEFPIPARWLINGSNVVAVEMHQVNPTSSDISFDLELRGVIGKRQPWMTIAPQCVDELSTNGCRMYISGDAPATFVVECSTNLVNWTAISTNTMWGSSIEVVDPAAGSGPPRFYRVRTE